MRLDFRSKVTLYFGLIKLTVVTFFFFYVCAFTALFSLLFVSAGLEEALCLCVGVCLPQREVSNGIG